MQKNKVHRWAILLFSIATLFLLGCETNLPTEAESQDLDEGSMLSLNKKSSNHTMPIALARADNPRDFIPDFMGETVTIQGVITTPNFRNPITQGESHFIQDNSAGIEFFAFPGISPVLEMGDEVVVTGVIMQFRGSTVIRLESASDLQIVGTRKLKKPKKIHAAHLADQVGEKNEGKLVVLKNVRIVDGDQFPPQGWWRLIRVVDSKGDTADVFIDSEYDIDGSVTPSGVFNLTGVATQFTYDTPADNGYQITPRGLFDIE